MRIEFNRTGAERKALVKAMGEILEVAPRYLGMPTAAYEVDYFRIDRNGTVEFDDHADSKEIENLLDCLAERGFTAAGTPDEPETEEVTAEAEPAPQGEDSGLTVEIPLGKVKIENLTKLLDAKGSLIKKALGIDGLRFEIREERIAFPWFNQMPDADECKAYTHFISALCRMSVEQKRVTATEKAVDNEKYAFRCFLLRLGFIGEEYKTDRKILLRNLAGSGAFKSGTRSSSSNL